MPLVINILGGGHTHANTHTHTHTHTDICTKTIVRNQVRTGQKHCRVATIKKVHPASGKNKVPLSPLSQCNN